MGKTRKRAVKPLRTPRTAVVQKKMALLPDLAPEISWLWGLVNLLPYGGPSLMETELFKRNSRPFGRRLHDWVGCSAKVVLLLEAPQKLQQTLQGQRVTPRRMLEMV